MKNILTLVGMLACLPALYAGEFRESFKGKLDKEWSWIREDAAGWRLTEKGLEVRIQPGNMWGGANNAKNVLVRPIPEAKSDPIEVTVTVRNQPTAQYEQVDLVWYYDDGNMVKLGQELVNGKLSIVMGREEGDRTRTIAIIPLDTHAVTLRQTVEGNRIRGEFKPAGTEQWQKAGECDLPVKGDPKISLQFYQGPADAEHWALVSDFAVKSP